MQRLINASLIGLTLLLTGCEGEPEDTPDIAEAIPLDGDGDGDGDGDDAEVNSGVEGEANSSDTPALPNASEEGEAPTSRKLPETMETGSNPPGMTAPPAGSKVQRLN